MTKWPPTLSSLLVEKGMADALPETSEPPSVPVGFSGERESAASSTSSEGETAPTAIPGATATAQTPTPGMEMTKDDEGKINFRLVIELILRHDASTLAKWMEKDETQPQTFLPVIISLVKNLPLHLLSFLSSMGCAAFEYPFAVTYVAKIILSLKKTIHACFLAKCQNEAFFDNEQTVCAMIDLFCQAVSHCALVLFKHYRYDASHGAFLVTNEDNNELSPLDICLECITLVYDTMAELSEGGVDNVEGTRGVDGIFISSLIRYIRIGDFMASILDFWGVLSNVLQTRKATGGKRRHRCGLALLSTIQAFSVFCKCDGFVNLFIEGDNMRVLKDKRLLLRLIHHVAQVATWGSLPDMNLTHSVSYDENGFDYALQLQLRHLSIRTLVILCEKQHPYLPDCINSEARVVESVVADISTSAVRLLSRDQRLQILCLEGFRLIELLSDDSCFRLIVMTYFTPVLAYLLSLTPALFRRKLALKSPTRGAMVIIFRIIANLHCFNPLVTRPEDQGLLLRLCMAEFRKSDALVAENLPSICTNLNFFLVCMKLATDMNGLLTPSDIGLVEDFSKDVQDVFGKFFSFVFTSPNRSLSSMEKYTPGKNAPSSNMCALRHIPVNMYSSLLVETHSLSPFQTEYRMISTFLQQLSPKPSFDNCDDASSSSSQSSS